LAGRDAGPLAEAFIDFMLSADFQEDIPLSMFVFPANSEAQLPDVFVDHAIQVPEPTALDPELIATERERWIEEWTDVVLR
ncbi:MAG: ABC transporter substrate-binding protein, partial [Chloroflexota bacterium]|nr:ABC transporter substrate-binding protein [Chloroflexota bacterium]